MAGLKGAFMSGNSDMIVKNLYVVLVVLHFYMQAFKTIQNTIDSRSDRYGRSFEPWPVYTDEDDNDPAVKVAATLFRFQ